MTNDPLEQQLRELCWRRKLNAAEAARVKAWLAAHPDEQADWDDESLLTEALEQLPPAPSLPSNFTARVLQAVERENAAAERNRAHGWLWGVWRLGWLPRVALAGLVLGLGLFSYERVAQNQRERIADSVLTVSQVASVASPEVLENFEAIQALGQTPPPDEELLTLFQ